MWLWIRILFFFAVFVLVALLPALSVIPVSAVPPLADMQVSEGTIGFRSAGGKSGSLTVIKKSDGGRDEFSCRTNLAGNHGCISHRYARGPAQVHWFSVRTLFGSSYKFPAQIVVNGAVVRDRSTAIEQIEDARVFFRFVFAPLAFIAFAVAVFMMVAPEGDVA